VLRKGPAGLLRVEDIATVELGTVPQWTRVTADGRDAVIFQVYQQPDANTVQIAGDVQAKLHDYAGQLPRGVKLASCMTRAS